MLKLLPSRLHVITSGRASTKAVVKGGGGGGGGGGEEEVGSTAICGLIEVCTAVNCRAFKVSFVWNRVQKSEDFGLK